MEKYFLSTCSRKNAPLTLCQTIIITLLLLLHYWKNRIVELTVNFFMELQLIIGIIMDLLTLSHCCPTWSINVFTSYILQLYLSEPGELVAKCTNASNTSLMALFHWLFSSNLLTFFAFPLLKSGTWYHFWFHLWRGSKPDLSGLLTKPSQATNFSNSSSLLMRLLAPFSISTFVKQNNYDSPTSYCS